MNHHKHIKQDYGKLFTQIHSLQNNIHEFITFKKNYSKSPITQRNHLTPVKVAAKNVNCSKKNQQRNHGNVKLSVSKFSKENKENQGNQDHQNGQLNNLLNLILKISQDNQQFKMTIAVLQSKYQKQKEKRKFLQKKIQKLQKQSSIGIQIDQIDEKKPTSRPTIRHEKSQQILQQQSHQIYKKHVNNNLIVQDQIQSFLLTHSNGILFESNQKKRNMQEQQTNNTKLAQNIKAAQKKRQKRQKLFKVLKELLYEELQ